MKFDRKGVLTCDRCGSKDIHIKREGYLYENPFGRTKLHRIASAVCGNCGNRVTLEEEG